MILKDAINRNSVIPKERNVVFLVGLSLWAYSVTELCLTLCDPVDCNPPVSCVHGILQRILEWIATSFSRATSQSRGLTSVSCIGRQILYRQATGEAIFLYRLFRASFSLFTWLCWVLVAACGIFVVSCSVFSCRAQTPVVTWGLQSTWVQ